MAIGGTASTWSTTGYGGAAAASTPGQGSIAYVGNNRTVTVTGSEDVEQLFVENTGTLDVSGDLALRSGGTTGSATIDAGGILSGSGDLRFERNNRTYTMTVNGTLSVSDLDLVASNLHVDFLSASGTVSLGLLHIRTGHVTNDHSNTITVTDLRIGENGTVELTNNGTMSVTNTTTRNTLYDLTTNGSGTLTITNIFDISPGTATTSSWTHQSGTVNIATLDFDVGTIDYTLANSGTMNITNLTVSGAGADVTWGGSGTLDVSTLMNLSGASATFVNNQTGDFDVWNLQYNASGITFTNNGTFSTTETVDVEEHIYFAPGSDNSTQVNNGTMTCDEILIQADGVRIENYGTFNINLELDEEDVLNCTLVNGTTSNHTATINFTDTADPGNAGGFDIENTMRVENHGVINQPGDFQGDETKAQFTLYNYSGSTWNFGGISERGSGGSGHTENLAMIDLFTDYATNTFDYNGAGNQTVFDPDDNIYHNLIISNSGTKTTPGAFDVQSDLTVSGSVTFDQNHRINVFDDVLITGSAIHTLAGNLFVYGDLTIEGTSQMTYDGASTTQGISMYGDPSTFSITSTDPDPYVPGTGRITIFGAVTLINTNGETFENLRIRSGGSLTLDAGSNTELIIDGIMEFNNGVVHTTSSSMLVFGPNAIVYDNVTDMNEEGGASNSYIDGPIKRIGNSDFVFPSGDEAAGVWAPLALTNIAGDTDDNDEYIVEYFPSAPSNRTNLSGLNHVSDVEYWEITHTAVGNAMTSTDLTLHWKSGDSHSMVSEDPVTADLTVAHYDGSNWVAESGSFSGGQTTGSVTATAISSFSPFSLGSTGGNNDLGAGILPVEFVEVSASVRGQDVQVGWTTSNEVNNDFFTVERSRDGYQFESVGMIDGAGNSSEILRYGFIDTAPLFGTSHYRIRQTDFDGSYDYSRVVTVQSISKDETIILTPNPTLDGKIAMTLGGLRQAEELSIALMDVSGTVVYTDKTLYQPASKLMLDLAESSLPKGVYILSVRSSQRMLSRKVIFR